LSRCTAARDDRGEDCGGVRAQALVYDDVLSITWDTERESAGKFAAQLGRPEHLGRELHIQSRAVVSAIVKANSEADKLPALLALRDRIVELTLL
jgi:hypothetical protein